MSFRKKSLSATLSFAEERLAGVKAIDPTLDLGGGLTATDFEQMILNLKVALQAYNTKLSSLDSESNAIDDAAQALKFFSRRILQAIGAIYGFDSNEYEMAGGTRRSDRKHSSKNADDHGESGIQDGTAGE